MNHQWVFWVSLAVIHLNFLEFGETQKSWGTFSKRSTFTKSISSSQAHHLVCSRKKTLTQSLEIERLSLRDFFVLLEEHTHWIITMMNFNYILYCSTVFSWNKHCSTKQMQPWNCLIYSYSELNIGDLQGRKKKKKTTQTLQRWMSHNLQDCIHIWNTATFRIKYNTVKQWTKTVKAKRWAICNFGKQRNFVGTLNYSFNDYWPFYGPITNLIISSLDLIYQFKKCLFLVKYLSFSLYVRFVQHYSYLPFYSAVLIFVKTLL